MLTGTMFGIPYTEIFYLFQAHRRKLLDWMEANPTDRNSVMEAVVRVVTGTGHRRPPRSASADGTGPQTPGFTLRDWNSMQRAGCLGRYVPDTESDGKVHHIEADTYIEWLRKVTTQNIDTEINVQVSWPGRVACILGALCIPIFSLRFCCCVGGLSSWASSH